MRYERPVRELLVESCLAMPDPFTLANVVVWFGIHYPDVAINTVRTQFHTLLGAGALPIVREAHGQYRHTSAPPSATSAPAPETTTPAVPMTTSTGHVVLVGCVKSKSPTAQPARSLYVSPLWQRRRAYAESSGRPWFVLSAKWGIVEPDEVIAPYDVALNEATKAYRTAWGEFAAQQLATRFPVRGLVVEIHAGDTYVDAIRGPLTRLGATVLDPVDATSMGGTLAWYDEPRATTSAATVAPRIDGQVVAALKSLDTTAQIHTVDQLLRSPPDGVDQPGLYSWWVDEQGARDLTRGLSLAVAAGLLYAGQAGATRDGGRESGNTLRGRLVGMHLRGSRRSSTFRHSLGVVLDSAFGVIGSEDDLSAWMHEHLGVAVWPTTDATSLKAVEHGALAALDPPFNLQGMSASAVRARLSELRRATPR